MNRFHMIHLPSIEENEMPKGSNGASKGRRPNDPGVASYLSNLDERSVVRIDQAAMESSNRSIGNQAVSIVIPDDSKENAPQSQGPVQQASKPGEQARREAGAPHAHQNPAPHRDSAPQEPVQQASLTGEQVRREAPALPAQQSPNPPRGSAPWMLDRQTSRAGEQARRESGAPHAQQGFNPPRESAPQRPVQQASKPGEQARREIPVLPAHQDPRVPKGSAPRRAEQQASRAGKTGLIFLSAISVILFATILILLAYIFKPFGLFQTQIDVNQPSQLQVQAAFNSTDIPSPTVTRFKYVDTSDLVMESIDQFESTEVEHGKSKGSPTATSEGRAVAHYRNSHISLDQQLATPLSYEPNSGKWTAGDPVEESVTATPMEAADANAIEDDIVSILKSHNSAVGAMYADADVSSDATLNLDGGTISFTLTKPLDASTSKTCVVDTSVSWDQYSGWNVSVNELSGDIDVTEESSQTAAADSSAGSSEPATAQAGDNGEGAIASSAEATTSNAVASNASSTSNAGPYGGATLYLECYSGDLVEIAGTVQFDQSGSVLIKSDARIAVILDSSTYITDYFEITGSNSFSNGQHLSIVGSISATGKLTQAPLVLNTNV